MRPFDLQIFHWNVEDRENNMFPNNVLDLNSPECVTQVDQLRSQNSSRKELGLSIFLNLRIVILYEPLQNVNDNSALEWLSTRVMKDTSL